MATIRKLDNHYSWGPEVEKFIASKSIEFSKCPSKEQVNIALHNLYEASPFKKGTLIISNVE
jgi:hypothetical protein